MIALLNPTSARWKHRFPLSLMYVGAALENLYPYEIIDQNLNKDALGRLELLASRNELKYLGITVMPGPQLFEAIPISKYLKDKFPSLRIIWGGYFSSLHAATVLNSGYVDFVVRGQGDQTFLELINLLEGNSKIALRDIPGLSFRSNGDVIQNSHRTPMDPNLMPPLPYHKVNGDRYVGKSCLGTRTAASYTSFGCPFLCGFCAIASVYRARWLAKTPEVMIHEVDELKQRYQINAIEFFDENFFTSEKRTREFSEKMTGRNIAWWGEGRPDTVLDYSDETLRAMSRGGCKMIFFGAESASEEVLKAMNKGGTQTPDTVLRLAGRLKRFNIIPEFSFVFGSPSETVDEDFDRNMRFIRTVKEINEHAEIVMYMYAPVVFDESELYQIAQRHGFAFPQTLDGWLDPKWHDFDLRKTPVIPWLKPRHYDTFKNFERVLNGYFPTVTDTRLSRRKRDILRLISSWRYKTQTLSAPFEIRLLFRLFRYRQPEFEGL
ncbi:MAG: B12-binding domain-containing radical SAM protein [Ignavibacteriales bacterium]|nr:B12-binding domain-containing radical SAM protein [Ignavibacteriales bacterium]